jgi:hypothetical protein
VSADAKSCEAAEPCGIDTLVRDGHSCPPSAVGAASAAEPCGTDTLFGRPFLAREDDRMGSRAFALS